MDVIVGRIGRAHGLRGEVAVEVRTDSPEERFAPGNVLRVSPPTSGAARAPFPESLTVEAARTHSGRLLVCFEGVADRTAAEALRGAVLVVDVDPDETTGDPDEFYDHQLIGLEAVRADDPEVRLGEVAEVLHLPMQDVLAVRTPDGSEVLVPFVADIVPEVDLPQRRVVVDPPPGLIPEGPEPSGERAEGAT
ncbi:MAG TPA: ribosome maturation factor RimM [Actinopolymorphaceae bacterium]